MNSDAPEFRTNISTPESPIPIHVPEALSVLRNQIDPVFNMTSTHTTNSNTLPITKNAEMASQSSHLLEGRSPSSIIDDGDMADAYGEEDRVGESRQQVSDAGSDDYAKTFDSDNIEEGETENTSSNAVANPDFDQQMRLPLAPVSANENAASTHFDPYPTTTSFSSNKQEISSVHAQPLPSSQPAGPNHNSNSGIPTTTTHSYEDIANGGVDIQQLLDNITAKAENAEASKNGTSPTTSHGPSFSNLSLPIHSSLPPRPQTHSKQPMHSSYVPHDDMRKFHAGPPNALQTHSAYRPAGISAPIIAGAGAPGTSTDPRNGLPPPPPASSFPASIHHLQAHAFSPARNNQLRLSDESFSTNDGREDTDTQWPLRVQKLYDEFLADERRYVTDGLWDIFPNGSRLFIGGPTFKEPCELNDTDLFKGNLPTEKVTKRDIFHVFYRYGKLAQIAIKQAYGFVQFHDVAACQKALQREQNAEVRGRKMHLEISKPQKNTPTSSRPGGVRARSPEVPRVQERGGRYPYGGPYGGDRGPHRGPDRGDRRGSFDRYDQRPGPNRPQMRDDYRPRRTPSPRGGYRGGREDYGRDEFGRDRERPRTRSRSPYNKNRNSRDYRQRSPSPRSVEAAEDSALKIPRRNPANIPDVQIILTEDLDRQFVSWVENEMRTLGLKTEVLLPNPNLSLPAVIRRQILEGVQAVAQLNRQSQQASKIPLQLFDHTKSPVTYDQYDPIEPKIAAQLVTRAKQARAAPPVPAYAPSQYAPQQAYQPQPALAPAVQAPNIASMVNQLDNNALQKLIASFNAGNQQQNSQIAPVQQPQQPSASVANFMTAYAQQQQPQALQQPQNGMQYQQQMQMQNSQQQNANPYAALTGNSNLAALLAGQAQTQAQGQGQMQQMRSGQQMPNGQQMSNVQQMPQGQSNSQVDVDRIMAALQRYH